VKLHKLPAFDTNGSVHIVVESPRGATAKFKYDPALEVFTLSRPLIDGVAYPYDWGFVPSTQGPDGDPLDAMILWPRSSYPGVVIPCRLIGVLQAEQNSRETPGTRERNDRLIAVPAGPRRYAHIADVAELPRRLLEELEAFFTAAAALEDKDLTFLGWSGPAGAAALTAASVIGRRIPGAKRQPRER
jgi:inorganic pyrophosphatase